MAAQNTNGLDKRHRDIEKPYEKTKMLVQHGMQLRNLRSIPDKYVPI